MTASSQPPDSKIETIRLLTEIAAGIAELRNDVHQLAERIDPIAETNARLAGCLEKLAATLAAQPAAAGAVSAVGGNGSEQPAGIYRDFHADTILLSYDDAGSPSYKIKGQPYTKFGVRVWPEALPALGIDAAALKPGPNPISIAVRAVLNPETNKPRKIIGPAT